MATSTTVQFSKYPDTPHWRFEMHYLGSDEHGTWLGAPAGTSGRRGSEPPVVFRDPFLGLIPPSGWWTMTVNATREPEIYVDVCTPATWHGTDRVEFVDLDLDVIRLRDGTVKLLDEDEFEHHRIELAYPPSLVANARMTAAELMLAVERGGPPFDDTASVWFETLAAAT